MNQIVHRALTRNRKHFIPAIYTVDRPDLGVSKGDPVLGQLGEPLYCNVDGMWLGGSWHMMINVDQQYTLESLPVDVIPTVLAVSHMDRNSQTQIPVVAGSFFFKLNSAEQPLVLPEGSRRECFSHNWMLVTLPLGATVCTWQREVITLDHFERIMRTVEDNLTMVTKPWLVGLAHSDPQVGRSVIDDRSHRAYWSQQDNIARRARL